MTIWKWNLNLTDQQTIQMPEGSRPLTVQIQGGDICMWSAVDPLAVKVPFTIIIVGTGNSGPDFSGSRYIGTVQQGPFVWHVFWRSETREKA